MLYGHTKFGEVKLISIIVRTVFMFIFVTVGIRFMGKRQIGDMQPNELVVTLLISEIAAIPLQDVNQPILNGVVAIFMLVILEILTSVLAMKSFFVRKVLSGKSVVIIKNGTIDQNAMRKVRMTVLDLVELLRGQNVFDLSTVAFAVLEVNGDLSVLLKSEAQTPSRGDFPLEKISDGLPLPVISDGKIVTESLTALSVSEAEIRAYLTERSLSEKDVFLLSVDRYRNYTLVRKRKESEP